MYVLLPLSPLGTIHYLWQGGGLVILENNTFILAEPHVKNIEISLPSNLKLQNLGIRAPSLCG